MLKRPMTKSKRRLLTGHSLCATMGDCCPGATTDSAIGMPPFFLLVKVLLPLADTLHYTICSLTSVASYYVAADLQLTLSLERALRQQCNRNHMVSRNRKRNASRNEKPHPDASEISTHTAIWLDAFLPKRTTDTADAPHLLRSSRFVCKVYHIVTGSYFFRFRPRTMPHSLPLQPLLGVTLHPPHRAISVPTLCSLAICHVVC